MVDGAEYAGVFADGWTPEGIAWASSNLADMLGGTLVCVWDYVDGWGAGGDSDIGLITTQPPVRVHHVADWVWEWLVDGVTPPSDRGTAHGDTVLLDLADEPWIAVDDTSFARTRKI